MSLANFYQVEQVVHLTQFSLYSYRFIRELKEKSHRKCKLVKKKERIEDSSSLMK